MIIIKKKIKVYYAFKKNIQRYCFKGNSVDFFQNHINHNKIEN